MWLFGKGPSSPKKNIGAIYYETGESDRAEAPLRESLRIARELKDKAREAISIYTLGVWEMYREHYSAALNYYEQSLALKPENPLLLTELLNNIGITHGLLGQSTQAVEFLRQALKAQEDDGNGTNPITLSLSNLGESLQSLGQLAEALDAQERALALTRKAGGMGQREWYYEKEDWQGQVRHGQCGRSSGALPGFYRRPRTPSPGCSCHRIRQGRRGCGQSGCLRRNR